uniref:NADH-ubiquinone oxidoreductase chain 6 n=1 Tax=Lysmata vittata TaxID=749979 RepID=A0A7D5U8Q9_9EUCA|nr:NADH dehydrogenase subunit 6 [Lysmata vittata]QLI42516.1 NADH dehydrogenase subunit 6 [Lysmata vittata]QQP21707.1 NADH dehydrogenase subunit 6 [Lysmata vittata]
MLNFSIMALFMALLFTQMSSPLSMGVTLLIQTLMICSIMSFFLKSVWFSYILFLIFLGAMLVLFIYIASIASNEKFHLSSLFFCLPFLVLMMTLFSFWDPMTLFQPFLTEFSSTTQKEISTSSSFHISMIYSPSYMSMTMFVIVYLLLTLVVVVKITGSFWGPLRLS